MSTRRGQRKSQFLTERAVLGKVVYVVWESLCLLLAYVYATLTFLTFQSHRGYQLYEFLLNVTQHIESEEGGKESEKHRYDSRFNQTLHWMVSGNNAVQTEGIRIEVGLHVVSLSHLKVSRREMCFIQHALLRVTLWWQHHGGVDCV